MNVTCYACQHKNPDGQAFCGSCGAPLSLSEYIARKVDIRVTETTRDKEVFERESAVLIFEKVFGWAKLVSGIAAALLGLLAIGATWRFLDLRSAANQAETAVGNARNSAEKQISETAASARNDMAAESIKSVDSSRTAAQQAAASGAQAQAVGKAQSAAILSEASGLRRDFQSQAATVTKDVGAARQQIQAASELQPQMTSLQQQLSVAQKQIQEQQHVITSSADFAKQIFSSHRQLAFDRNLLPKSRFAIISSTIPQPAQPGQQAKQSSTTSLPVSALYLLLPETPASGTVQVQFNQLPAPPNSFIEFHNLLVLFIEPSAIEVLLGKSVYVSYFPDPADKESIQSLEVKDGRVFGDGEALPKFGELSDQGFKGSKWMLAMPTVPIPLAAPAKPAPK